MNQIIDFACTVQGYNHIKKGKVCEDASKCYTFINDEEIAIIAVADGHGSDNYPRADRGSKFAAEIAISSTRTFINDIKSENIDLTSEYQDFLERLEKNILLRWHEFVKRDVIENPFKEDELSAVAEKYKEYYLNGHNVAKAYGTTLIMSCITKDFWFGIQIGDGKCVTISESGKTFEPIPRNENCQSNITTSICDNDAITEFRHHLSVDLPLAIFVGCDGVGDSYTDDDELYSLYRSILIIFAEHGADVGINEVNEFLPLLSSRGSGDDVSIAGIIRMDTAREKLELLKVRNEYMTAITNKISAQKKVDSTKEQLDYIKNAVCQTFEKIEKAKILYETFCEKKESAENDYIIACNCLIKAENTFKEVEIKMENLSSNDAQFVSDKINNINLG